jgi:hypothetical protein
MSVVCIKCHNVIDDSEVTQDNQCLLCGEFQCKRCGPVNRAGNCQVCDDYFTHASAIFNIVDPIPAAQKMFSNAFSARTKQRK